MPRKETEARPWPKEGSGATSTLGNQSICTTSPSSLSYLAMRRTTMSDMDPEHSSLVYMVNEHPLKDIMKLVLFVRAIISIHP